MIIISRRMRRAGHVARVGKMGNAYTIFVGKSEEKGQLENMGVDGRMILEWILQKQRVTMWTESSDPGWV
jgi:hypothetical protein